MRSPVRAWLAGQMYVARRAGQRCGGANLRAAAGIHIARWIAAGSWSTDGGMQAVVSLAGQLHHEAAERSE
jgi:hypothetical protein